MWLPPEVRRNDAWPDSFRESFLAKREARKVPDLMHVERQREGRPYEELFRRHAGPYADDPFKGTVERRVAPREMPSVEGDARAARAALQDAGLEPSDISMLLSNAVVPDRVCPPNAPAVAHLAGCINAAALGVDAYCGSAPAQLELAAALIEGGRARFVVCVQSQHIWRVMDFSHPSSPVFGDASTAFVVGPVQGDRGLLGVARGTDGSLAGAVTWNYVGKPSTEWWCSAEGPIYLGADDSDALRRLVDNALAYPIETLQEACRAANVSTDDLAAVAMIQPLAWYQAAVAEGLGISTERVPSTHARYAHLGGGGVVANLVEARELGLLRDGSAVALYGHGAGMTRYAAVLRWGR
jgi:3-oxoacyl-[acyl-carrier-protein] synthase-3